MQRGLQWWCSVSLKGYIIQAQNLSNLTFTMCVLLLLPEQSFWTRLSGKYGNKFYWQEKGEAAAILDAGE